MPRNPRSEELDLDGAFDLHTISDVKIVELAGRLFVRGGDCWDLDRTNSPTSARRGDGLENIRIWATPPKRLVF